MSDDTVNGGLIDVSGLSLSELRDEADGSGLASALQRILAVQEEAGHHGFNSTI